MSYYKQRGIYKPNIRDLRERERFKRSLRFVGGSKEFLGVWMFGVWANLMENVLEQFGQFEWKFRLEGILEPMAIFVRSKNYSR